MTSASTQSPAEPADYDKLVDMFNQALIHTLRKHSVADSFLDFWVPDSDPVIGILSMIDSARFAGLPSLAIRVSKKTLPASRLAEFELAAAKIGKTTIEAGADGYLIRASEMSKDARADGSAGAGRVARREYWRPESATIEAKPAGASGTWSSNELPEFADVHPHFREPLSRAFSNLAFEVTAPPPPAGDAIRVIGEDGPVRLTLDVDGKTQVVLGATHSGGASPAERAILDLFCRAAKGLPIQEAADHLGLKILDSLVDEDRGPPVPGVLLPSNSGKPFALPGHIARRAYDAFRATTGAKLETNFYYPPPSGAWQALSAEERSENVERVIRAFLQSRELFQDDIALHRVEKNRYGYFVRVIVAFSDRISVEQKPHLMRQLESRLRRDVEPELDLVAERVKDTSPLRRLS